MNRSAPPINATPDAASGPPAITDQSSPAMGTSVASATAATIPIGRSRSPIASSAPSRRAEAAASEERMPPMTGPMIFRSVQIAATPITPAPRKRTSRLKIPPAHSATGPVEGAMAVRMGSATHQPMAIPASMAIPTDRPTRCPTPIRANDSPPEMPVAPAPVRNQTLASATASLV